MRLVNHSARPGEVRVIALDGAGTERARMTLSVEAGGTARFDSSDMARAAAAGTLAGSGGGDWRLRLESDVLIQALAWVRGADGAQTALLDEPVTAPTQLPPTAGATQDPLEVAAGAFAGAAQDISGLRGIHGADLDGDGDADVLSVLFDRDTLVWQENIGAGQLSAPRPVSTRIDGPYSGHTADLDRDGDADVLSASEFDDTIA